MLPASLMSLTLGYGPHWPSQAPDLDSISHPSAFLNPSPRACSSSSLWSLVDWSLPFYSLPAPSSPTAVLPSWGLGTSHCSDAWVGVLASSDFYHCILLANPSLADGMNLSTRSKCCKTGLMDLAAEVRVWLSLCHLGCTVILLRIVNGLPWLSFTSTLTTLFTSPLTEMHLNATT